MYVYVCVCISSNHPYYNNVFYIQWYFIHIQNSIFSGLSAGLSKFPKRVDPFLENQFGIPYI